ncbi:MAG: class I SAM-dependent methyltransferase [Candidatus Thorarchaeota archaeon]
MNDKNEDPSIEKRVHMVGPYTLDISEVKMEGRILDIGGGGEGIIGQFKKEKVTAIDIKKSELEEAKDAGYLKIIMDAKDLKFLDNTFDTVTAFFSLMYVPASDHNLIFQEIIRVLKKGGEFLLWDVNIPERSSQAKDLYGIYLSVQIPNKLIETGYAVHWIRRKDAKYYIETAQKVGFEIINQDIETDIFFIRFKK